MPFHPHRRASRRQQSGPCCSGDALGEGALVKSLSTLAPTFLACVVTSSRAPLPRVNGKAFATECPAYEGTNGQQQIGISGPCWALSAFHSHFQGITSVLCRVLFWQHTAIYIAPSIGGGPLGGGGGLVKLIRRPVSTCQARDATVGYHSMGSLRPWPNGVFVFHDFHWQRQLT